MSQTPERPVPAQGPQPPVQQFSTGQQTSNWIAEQQRTWEDYELSYEQMHPNPLNPNTVVEHFTNHWDMRNMWFNSQPSHALFNFEHASETIGSSITTRGDVMLSAQERAQVDVITGEGNPSDETEVYMPSAAFYGTPNPFLYMPLAQNNRDFEFEAEQESP